ncbi:hypothetical protein P4O66_017502 [Electrophorus voltai]|uniref:PH domain-containing protein n=1 Tax=Electrophorus voltai TaxID=2609070 RepID=A0AAD8YTQ9_9TELE|nr:hypothetical protein P4O66_017502 [Electrophorus voltai]
MCLNVFGSTVLARLVSDLQAFLQVLDGENLSYIAQAQKKSIYELLSKVQDLKDAPVEDAEYMIMNCSSGGPSSEPRLSSALEADTPGHPFSCTSAGWLQDKSVGPDVTLHASEVEEDDDCYEEAEPFIPVSQPTDKPDSDSSHYESYGEDEDEDFVKDRAHYIQWSASQPSLRPSSESRVCGYLWRKKWLGQWTRQLFVIKHNCLLCFKCAKDLHPLLELKLSGCQVMYKSTPGKRMQSELKVVCGSDTLILGFQSCSQAEDWRKVIEEVSSSSYYEPESHSSSLKSERLECSRSSAALYTDSDEETLPGLHSAVSSLEINKEQIRAGYLSVLMSYQWQTLWCRVEAGLLKMFRDPSSDLSPQYTVQLQGSEIQPGPDTAHAYRITILQHGDQVAVLEVGCSDDKENWVHLLQDGSTNQNTEPLSGLKVRRFPKSNTYIDDPFQQLCGGVHSQPIYSNASILEHMFQKSPTGGNTDSPSDPANYSNNDLLHQLGE